MHHVLDKLHIETARRHISSHQNGIGSLSKPLQILVMHPNKYIILFI